MTLSDIEELNRVSAAVIDAIHRIATDDRIAPANRAEAKAAFVEAFADGRRENPRFSYTSAPADLSVVVGDASLTDIDEPWRTLLTAELEGARASAVIFRDRNPPDVTAHTTTRYGFPDAETLTAARAYLDGTSAVAPDPAAADIPAAEAAGFMQAALSAVGLHTWTVVTSATIAARMATKNAQRLIRVREDGAFSARELRRLIIHEIGTHVFRYENASRQPVRLLSHGLGGYLRTEEGMAVWQEANAGLTSTAVMRLYALRYIACDAALTGDFCAVVDALLPHTSLAESYEIAMRVKRGLTDTSAPGGYLKDQVYFAGYRQITQHLADHPSDYPLLMSSKWPVERIDVLRRLRDGGLMEPPRFLPADLLAVTA